MEKSIKIGSSVLYTHIDEEKTEVWSGFVTNLYTKDTTQCASIDIDGIVVPPMKQHGILGPLPWKNAIECFLSDLTLRQTQPDDTEKRLKWFDKVGDYLEAQAALDRAKFNVKKQRYSHISPGMAVTWDSKQGIISKIDTSVYYAVVEQTTPTQVKTHRINMDNLTFI